MSKKTIRESLLELDRKFLGTDKYKDLTSLYESQDLSGKDKATLKKLINDIKDKEDLQDAIMSVLQEEVNDDFDYDETPEWEMTDKKSVLDYDGFWTDYSLWHNLITDEWVCIFGDIDLYNPVTTYSDAEFETEDEAREWFEGYNGFVFDDNDLDEEYFTKDSIPLEEEVNFENNQMIIEIISGISGDRLIISIISNNEIVFKKEYAYGYNASYSKAFKNPKAPYINDIITDLCDQYNISRQNIQVIPGGNVFRDTKVSNNVIDDFIKNHLPLEEDWQDIYKPYPGADYNFQTLIQNNKKIGYIEYHDNDGDWSYCAYLNISDKNNPTKLEDYELLGNFKSREEAQKAIANKLGLKECAEKTLSESDTLNDDEFDYFAVYEGEILQGEYPTYFDAKENCKGNSCTIKGVKQYGPNEYEETPLTEAYDDTEDIDYVFVASMVTSDFDSYENRHELYDDNFSIETSEEIDKLEKTLNSKLSKIYNNYDFYVSCIEEDEPAGEDLLLVWFNVSFPSNIDKKDFETNVAKIVNDTYPWYFIKEVPNYDDIMYLKDLVADAGYEYRL